LAGGAIVTRVLAAIDSSAAARPVLSAAKALADLLGADVDALHVRERASATAKAAADAAGMHLTLLSGRALERIIQEAGRPDVVAVVLGARATPGGARPAGHVATHVATSSRKPIVVVPPDCEVPVRLRRILVPLDAVMATASAVDTAVLAAATGGAEVVVVHVMTEQALPSFTDQPQHEVEAWTNEFRRRYCDHTGVRLEVRMGVPRDRVLAFADEMQADAIILAWSQRLVAERAALVRSVLARSRIPVILVPVARNVKRVPTRSARRRGPGISKPGTAIRLRTPPGGPRHEANAGRLRRN
jgi:nucleotide-binding universal stress UspA family protein